ncbi:MAG: leucine-rich repeat protein, partial [Clostridia bacterium]|nr:leucine-rich repeat protein [Clostridia bacterium]
DGVTTIPTYAFSCNSLTSVTIGNSVTSIGSSAFDWCGSLTSVYITDIAAWCNISFSNSYANPLYYANNLYLNGELVTDLVIPDGVTSIGDYAFRNCDSLTSVTIGNSVTSIGSYAFAYCSSLTSVYITDIAAWCNISFIDSYANPLYYADNLYLNGELVTGLVIPDGVTTIPTYAFSCNSLTSVTIGNSVTSIGSSAFYGCSGLTSITIPDSVTSIGNYAFYSCDSLTNINVDENNGYYRSIDGNLYTKDGKTLIQYAIGKTDTVFIIPNSVTSIGNYAFEYCDSLTSVVIPDSVTSIGYDAFRDCDSLKSVYITDIAAWCNISFGSSDANPLYYADNLYLNGELVTDLVIPDGVTSIGDYAFRNCDSLTSVIIPDSVTSIGNYAFEYCDSLTIYCEAASEPSGWDSYWNYSNLPVVWGYTGEEYTYNFNTNGGGEIESVTTDSSFALPTPIKDGWYFGGWYDNAEFSGNPVSSPYSSKTAHTLYAKWMTEEEYLASLDGSSFEKAYIITSGESLPAVIDTAGEYVYFKFTATEAKTYTFQSSGSYDTYGYLYNASQSQLSSNDESGDGSNFKITRSMSAGEVVYLKVKLYSSSNTGTFTVSVG